MPSVAAPNAQKTAEKHLEWTSDPSHNSSFGTFSSNMVSQLETCFVGTQRCLQRCREKMWENLFKLHASARFKACWSSFLHESIGVPACPIFFQYVVDHIFHILVKQHHQFDKAEENIDV